MECGDERLPSERARRADRENHAVFANVTVPLRVFDRLNRRIWRFLQFPQEPSVRLPIASGLNQDVDRVPRECYA